MSWAEFVYTWTLHVTYQKNMTSSKSVAWSSHKLIQNYKNHGGGGGGSQNYIGGPRVIHLIHTIPYCRRHPFYPEDGVGQTQAWIPTYVSILRIPQMIWVWRATVEWYWQGKTEELWEKPVPVPLCPPHIPHRLTRARTRASAVRDRRLTTWAMARPHERP
jgi:hypothetical protein